jgi:uncharacterized protein (DUF2252 family)
MNHSTSDWRDVSAKDARRMTSPIPTVSRLPVDTTPQERIAEGRTLRKIVPRSAHAAWSPSRERANVVETLEATNRGRIQSLVPIRYGRMLASPFTFLRGSSAVMADDLARTPQIGVWPQICGDAHLGNFGGFATPERNLIFDLNDFDETMQGPWEWDIKRLAASVFVCGRVNGLPDHRCRDAVRKTARLYRERMWVYAEMRYLDIWYERIDAEQAVDHGDTGLEPLEKAFDKGRRKTNVESLPKYAQLVDGVWIIIDDPPLLTHRARALTTGFPEFFASYKESLAEDQRTILERYRMVDLARKVVGIGSVGTRCYVALFLGSHEDDPLFLQVKEARRSVLAHALGRGPHAHHGERVVVGQRIMQSASDPFLGWARIGRGYYYVRQLRDMKSSVVLDRLDANELADYGSLCAWTLARAHACSGDAARIGGYLGSQSYFDEAIATFAAAYADQTERDYEVLVSAVKDGKVTAVTGL